MDYRSIGRAGVQVSALCLPRLLFSGPTDEADPIWLLDCVLDTDTNFLDTASILTIPLPVISGHPCGATVKRP